MDRECKEAIVRAASTRVLGRTKPVRSPRALRTRWLHETGSPAERGEACSGREGSAQRIPGSSPGPIGSRAWLPDLACADPLEDPLYVPLKVLELCSRRI